MSKTRSYVLTLAVIFGAALAGSSPSSPRPSESSGTVDLGPAAGLVQALSGSSHGSMNRLAMQQASTRAAQAASVAGVEGAGRSVIGIGDVNADARTDLLDLRANAKALTVTGVSGHNGSAIWTRQFTGASTIYGAAFPAAIDEAGGDAYLLVQWANEGMLSWSLYAVDGATGVDRWTQTGQLASGLPTIPPSPPAIPPTLPPIPTLPPVPTAAPTALPTATPTELPTVSPSATPTAAPTTAPSVEPSALPTTPPTGLPTSVPNPLPTESPTGVPTTLPTTVPSVPPTLPPLPVVPSMPPAGSSSSSSRMAPASSDADAENPVLPATLEAFTLGLRPVDVDGDTRADFPLVSYETGIGPDGIPVMAATLVTLSASGGSTVGVIAGVGRGAVPYVGVAGDMTADGKPDLVASNELVDPTAGVSATTWLAAANNSRPLWAALDRFDAGSVAVVDAGSDVTGDHAADLVIHRIPAAGSGKNAVLAVRAGVNGLDVWHTELPEASVVTVGPRIDADEAADIITQSIVAASPETIPTKVSYRALSGADAEQIYTEDYAFPCAGCPGVWTATLTGDAGDLDADGSNDMTHSIGSYPSTAASASSQAGVNVRTGAALWTLSCACAPSTPVQANIAGGEGQDLIEAKEVVTRYTDAISLRAASGNDAASLWATSVVVGTGNDRIRSITITPADLTEPARADVIVTVVQQSGSVWRSLVIAVRGSTGRVLWIRTK